MSDLMDLATVLLWAWLWLVAAILTGSLIGRLIVRWLWGSDR